MLPQFNFGQHYDNKTLISPILIVMSILSGLVEFFKSIS